MWHGAGTVTDREQRIKNSVAHAVEGAFFSNLDGHVGSFKVKQHNGDRVAIYDQTQADPIVIGGLRDVTKWLEDHLLTEIPVNTLQDRVNAKIQDTCDSLEKMIQPVKA